MRQRWRRSYLPSKESLSQRICPLCRKSRSKHKFCYSAQISKKKKTEYLLTNLGTSVNASYWQVLAPPHSQARWKLRVRSMDASTVNSQKVSWIAGLVLRKNPLVFHASTSRTVIWLQQRKQKTRRLLSKRALTLAAYCVEWRLVMELAHMCIPKTTMFNTS